MSDDERESEPGELLRSHRPGEDEDEEPKRHGSTGERGDDPDHGYGQLVPSPARCGRGEPLCSAPEQVTRCEDGAIGERDASCRAAR